MKKMVELMFRSYVDKMDEIESGFITKENIDWVTDHLMLTKLTNEELSEIWETTCKYFDELFDREYLDHKKGSFILDTKSAWLEVINVEARKRRASGTLK